MSEERGEAPASIYFPQAAEGNKSQTFLRSLNPPFFSGILRKKYFSLRAPEKDGEESKGEEYYTQTVESLSLFPHFCALFIASSAPPPTQTMSLEKTELGGGGSVEVSVSFGSGGTISFSPTLLSPYFSENKGRIGCQDPKVDLYSASTAQKRKVFAVDKFSLCFCSSHSTLVLFPEKHFCAQPCESRKGTPLPPLPPLISFLLGEYPSFFSFRLFVTKASKTKEEAKNFGRGKRRGAFLCKQTAKASPPPPTEIRNFLLLLLRCLSENAFLLSKTFSQRTRRCRRRRSSQQARKRTEIPRFVTSNNLCFAMSLLSQYTRHFRRDIWRISYVLRFLAESSVHLSKS